jgi:hypothetical protein
VHYALCDYVLDVAQNAVEAGSREVRIVFAESDEAISVVVSDDGRGMTAEERSRALDPFYSDGTKHVKRKVGLGLPFLAQAIAQAGGKWSLESERGKGTTVSFSFPKGNVDCPPTGDVPELFLSALCLPGGHEMVVRRVRPASAGESGGVSSEYELRRSELSEAVGGLERVSSLALLRDYLKSQEESIEPDA